MSNEEFPEQQGQYGGSGEPDPRYGAWQPTPQGGEYDADATAFVHLPPEDPADAPLAAPGHGFVPPMILPLTPAAGLDPSATGGWVVRTQEPRDGYPGQGRPDQGQPRDPGYPAQDQGYPDQGRGHGDHGQGHAEQGRAGDEVHWPDPNRQNPYGGYPQYEQSGTDTAQWHFSDVPRDDDARHDAPYGNTPYVNAPYGEAAYGAAAYGGEAYGGEAAQAEPRQDDGRYDDVRYQEPRHDDGRYDGTRHEGGPHDGPRHEDGREAGAAGIDAGAEAAQAYAQYPQQADDWPETAPRDTGAEPWRPESAAEQWRRAEDASAEGADAPFRAETAAGHTGQWTIPVADGDLPDESGEYAAPAAAPQWYTGATPPATLPGGAAAPWATHRFAEPQQPAPGHTYPEPGPGDAPSGFADGSGGFHPGGEPGGPDAEFRHADLHQEDLRQGDPRFDVGAEAHPATAHRSEDAEDDGRPGAGPAGHAETEDRHAETEDRHAETEDRHAETEDRHAETEDRHAAAEDRFAETEDDFAGAADGSRPAGQRAGNGTGGAYGADQGDFYGTDQGYGPSGQVTGAHADPETDPDDVSVAPGAGPEGATDTVPDTDTDTDTGSGPVAAADPDPGPAAESPAGGTPAPEAFAPDLAGAPHGPAADPEYAPEPAEPHESHEHPGTPGPVDADRDAEPVTEAEPDADPEAGPATDAEPDTEAGPGTDPDAEPDTVPGAPDTVPAAPDTVPGHGEARTETQAAAQDHETGRDAFHPGEPSVAGPDPAPHEDPAPPLLPSEHPSVSYVLHVNGADRPVSDAWIGESLLYVLRERLGLAGAKDGCSQGECGACNVQVDGRLVASCLVPAATAAGSEVRTVEGLAVDGEPSDVQRALAACGAVQCGFCIPGMAMTVHDLLEGNHAPSELQTRQALSGNLCRCSGYRGVLDAVRDVVATRAASADAATAPAADTDEAHLPHQAGPDGSDAPAPAGPFDGGTR